MTWTAGSAAGEAVLSLGMLAVSALLPACGSDADKSAATSPQASSLDGKSPASALGLQLVAEKKLSKLFSSKDIDHYEASGVVASSGTLYVASDNTTEIGAVDTSLNEGTLGPGDATDSQYEAITVTDDGRFYAMIESADATDTRGAVAELDATTTLVGQAFTDVAFEHVNKGFEGLAWLRIAGTEYLLALCENNNCTDDDSTPGKGRIKLLTLVGGVWTTEATLKLPSSVAFLNYSDLALQQNDDGTFAVAIVSHKSSALWLGTLSTSPWALTGPGIFYAFPRTADGAIQYCSVEGVTFLGPSVFAVVSDKADGSTVCSAKEESIHIFQTPL
ncbi:MAG TPA: hypothetical protein VHW01_15570 [Polyangiaceae bacterium]|nr:hypothetical protein [Polyangiaceae bacterium]